MGRDVVFVRPVEKVGIVYDIFKSCTHFNFPVVDTDDNYILFGTIGRLKLCTVLQNCAYGNCIDGKFFIRNEDYAKKSIEIEPDKQKFFPSAVSFETLILLARIYQEVNFYVKAQSIAF